MSICTTEITSDQIASDNPLHQRLLKAYHVAVPFIKGDVLELGCGEGRGVDIISKIANSYLALDKIPEVINTLSERFPDQQFKQAIFPPVDLPDESFDTVVNFQVIEHIKDDHLYLKEIARLLKPGGTAIISTPNINMTLSRNPWHIREYTGDELVGICKKYFSKVDMQGIAGSKRVMEYHEKNRVSVQKIMKWDLLDLQYRLPRWLLQKPYEILNRRNRNKLKAGNDELVNVISQEDYFLRKQDDLNLDLFCVLTK
ncbi:MAG: class I SAM-dependent methyltransferase [Cytophagales bacterium]|nr:class I SAM-dependent methyltransferase [Cytophagales bacterium]